MDKNGHGGGHPSSVHQERFLEILCASSQNGKSVKDRVTVPCLSVCLFSISFLYPSGSCIFPGPSRGLNGPLSIRVSAFSAYTPKGPNLPVRKGPAAGLDDWFIGPCTQCLRSAASREEPCLESPWLFGFAWHRRGETICILSYHMHL